MDASLEAYKCRICMKEFTNKTSMVEHLRQEHEMLEVFSYAASTMIMEEDRDRVAREFFAQLEHIKRETSET